MYDRIASCPRTPGLVAGCALALGLAALPAASADTAGYIYGTVTTTKADAYTGLLRWDGEEAFWDDHFNSAKSELPYLEGRGAEGGGTTIKVLGKEIRLRWPTGGGRQFIARFGDLARIDVAGDDEAKLTMRDGTEVKVEGHGNDVEADVEIDDAELGTVVVPWKRIQSVEFKPTPAAAKPPGFRLRGKVTTTEAEFRGFVQWDSEECLSTDKLDGDDEDDVSVSIEMGKLRSIARHSRSSSEIVLKDGRRLVLSGTNDVDDDIRGILVEDPRYGRVKIGWDDFRQVVFEDEGPSGAGYEAYSKGGPLRGTVTGTDGRKHTGRIVYDLDEAYTWEMLDGDDDDLSYAVPFALVRSIEPLGSSSARVTLKSGESLRLEDTQDVSEENAGVAVVRPEGEPTYLAWDEIVRIELEA